VAVGHSVEVAGWAAETDRLLDRMAGRFARVETRRRARGFLLGLLADLPRKSCWTIAEHAGELDPHGMQHFLARASWDTDGVRDDLRDYVVGALGEADGVLVVDETGVWVPRTRSRHATCRYSCRRPPSRSRRRGRMAAPEVGGVWPAGGC
jgi:SRSO17 transposase